MTRPEKAGIQMALAIIEMINIAYPYKKAMQYLKGLAGTIMSEIKLRKKGG